MNEPWENQDNRPESIKVSEELAKSKDDVSINIPIISKKCNPDDIVWSIANKLFGWIWRGK